MIVAISICDPMLQRALKDGLYRIGFEPRVLRDRSELGVDPSVSALVLDDGVVGLEELVATARERLPAARIIVLAGRSDVRARISALGLGVDEILRKPLDLEAVAGALRAARRGRGEPALGQSTQSPCMREVLAVLERVAESDLTVCLAGEAGTGRSRLARALHDCGGRQGPFTEVIAHDLEGEPPGETEPKPAPLDRGAQTRAFGWLASAAGGTLVLDGIEQFSHRAQQDLLQALALAENQDRTGRRARARIVAIASRPLELLSASGSLSEHLARRLDVVSVQVPPLRERLEDLHALCATFLTRFALELDQEPARITPEILAALSERSFGGNVRELENLMARAAVVFPGEAIRMRWIDSSLEGSFEAPLPDLNLKRLERAAIEHSLALTRGSRTAAARALGISVRTLRNKIRRYELA